jgi:hypothetical protein
MHMQRRDVVDERRARGQGALGDLDLHRVHRDLRAYAGGDQRLDHGHDPPRLLITLDRVRSRPRRLATDVEDRRPLRLERKPVLDRGSRIEVTAGITE